MARRHSSNFQDLTGRLFGELTVLKFAYKRGGSKGMCIWRCTCSCGRTTWVAGSQLKNGRTRSCGHLSRQITAEMNRNRTKHGMWETPEYQAWASMKQRCLNPNNQQFINYGGRGIKVCEKWLNFQNFYNDVGSRPDSDHSIDRIDNDGNYEPGNVRWATRSQQVRNRRPFVRLR